MQKESQIAIGATLTLCVLAGVSYLTLARYTAPVAESVDPLAEIFTSDEKPSAPENPIDDLIQTAGEDTIPAGPEEDPLSRLLSGGLDDQKAESSTHRRPLSAEEGQKVFDNAFLASQSGAETPQAGMLDLTAKLEVKDNTNNVLPSELEAMSARLNFAYDVRNPEQTTGDGIIEFSLNNAKDPDFKLSGSLVERTLSYTVENLSDRVWTLLDLEANPEFTKLIGVAQKKLLGEDEYKELIASLNSASSESGLKNNTPEQERAIADAFVESGIIKIDSVTIEQEMYILKFKTAPENVASFLTKVAEINGVKNDFASEKDFLSKLEIGGKAVVNTDRELQYISAEIFVPRTLMPEADKDVLLEVEYKFTDNQNTFTLKLLDSLEQTVQATLSLQWNFSQ